MGEGRGRRKSTTTAVNFFPLVAQSQVCSLWSLWNLWGQGDRLRPLFERAQKRTPVRRRNKQLLFIFFRAGYTGATILTVHDIQSVACLQRVSRHKGSYCAPASGRRSPMLHMINFLGNSCFVKQCYNNSRKTCLLKSFVSYCRCFL